MVVPLAVRVRAIVDVKVLAGVIVKDGVTQVVILVVGIHAMVLAPVAVQNKRMRNY